MNIVTEKEVSGRLIDGMKTILTLSDEDFNRLLEELVPPKGKEYLENIRFYYVTDLSECPSNPIQLGLEKTHEAGKFIGRSYYGAKTVPTYELFYQFKQLLSHFEPNSKNYKRIVEILKTRDIEAFKLSLLDKKIGDKDLLDKVFEILSDEDTFNKFLDFENNREDFHIDGKSRELSEYLRCLGSIYGNKNSVGLLEKAKDIYNNYYIPDFYTYGERYRKIFDSYNMDRYVNPLYEFRGFNSLTHIHDRIIRKDEEPNWKINPELREAVYKDFPEDATLEEKVMYIYCKLCKELQYDEGYFYRDKLSEDCYEHTFSQEHLEGIKPDSPVTCWDFSRICSKMINELEGDIEAVILSECENQGHFSVGFYTDKVSAILEAINAKTKGTNDLMKAKNGIELEGIEIVSDRQGLINTAIESVYPKALGRNQIDIIKYMMSLKALPETIVEDNLENKIQAFTSVMRENNIYGNEAMQALNVYYNAGFFGEKLKKAYVGRESIDSGQRKFKRSVLIVSKTESMLPDTVVYSIDTQSLKLSKHSAQDIINSLNSGEIIYENKNHTLPDVDGEGR